VLFDKLHSHKCEGEKPQRTRLWNPFQDGPHWRHNLNRFFRFRSYHRTGAESYYAGKATCKRSFYIFFTAYAPMTHIFGKQNPRVAPQLTQMARIETLCRTRRRLWKSQDFLFNPFRPQGLEASFAASGALCLSFWGWCWQPALRGQLDWQRAKKTPLNMGWD
jgi:hypothetical protein